MPLVKTRSTENIARLAANISIGPSEAMQERVAMGLARPLFGGFPQILRSRSKPQLPDISDVEQQPQVDRPPQEPVSVATALQPARKPNQPLDTSTLVADDADKGKRTRLVRSSVMWKTDNQKTHDEVAQQPPALPTLARKPNAFARSTSITQLKDAEENDQGSVADIAAPHVETVTTKFQQAFYDASETMPLSPDSVESNTSFKKSQLRITQRLNQPDIRSVDSASNLSPNGTDLLSLGEAASEFSVATGALQYQFHIYQRCRVGA
jgi:hypothetical protein